VKTVTFLSWKFAGDAERNTKNIITAGDESLGSPPTADHGKFGTNMSDWRWLETIYEGHGI
jgi:hypothetical protein